MSFEKFFRHLCSSFDEENISFLVLRNYDLLPISFGNDIDLLVLPSQVKKTREVIGRVASVNNFSLTKERMRFNFQSLELHSNSNSQSIIKIDIFSGLTKGWVTYMSVDEILDKKIIRECFYIPTIEIEIYCLILKEMYMYGNVRGKYKSYFKQKLPYIDLDTLKSLLLSHLTKTSAEFILYNLNALYEVKHYPKPKLLLLFDFKNIVKWFYLNVQDKISFRR